MVTGPLVARQPNERLRALIQEAGCSHAGLARRVNVCGAEHGLDLRYDKTSVARWLRGQQPRGRAPVVIAEALGRKLGRTVAPADIGMADGGRPASGVGLHFAPTLQGAVEHAGALWHADAGGRDDLTAVPGVRRAGSAERADGAAALVGPSRDWLVTAPDGHVARGSGRRVGMADVAAVRAMTVALAGLDHRYGSGHVRAVVVHYLDGVVAGLLAGSYRETVGRALFSAAARLTELAGYMAVDTGRPGLAQRCYIQALRLAQAGGDRAYGGYVLAAGMSHLAASLGSPREAAQLARAAQEGARGRATPRTQALFRAAEARGHALLGEERACRELAGRARAAMERAEAEGASGDDPAWIAHFDRAYLADELAHCHHDLGRPREAAACAEEALAGHPEARARRRAVGLLLLATSRLRGGELEHACRTGTEAVEILAGLRSQRGVEYLAGFRRRLRGHEDEPVVREFAAALERKEAA